MKSEVFWEMIEKQHSELCDQDDRLIIVKSVEGANDICRRTTLVHNDPGMKIEIKLLIALAVWTFVMYRLTGAIMAMTFPVYIVGLTDVWFDPTTGEIIFKTGPTILFLLAGVWLVVACWLQVKASRALRAIG